MLQIALSLLPLLWKYAQPIVSAWNSTSSNSTFNSYLSTLEKPVLDFVTSVGSQLFPKASPTLHALAGAIAAFNPDYIKWVQGSLNAVMPFLGLPNPNLVVDGIAGKHTVAAVEAVQTHFGVVVDGLPGNITYGLIQEALNLLGKLPKVAAPA